MKFYNIVKVTLNQAKGYTVKKKKIRAAIAMAVYKCYLTRARKCDNFFIMKNHQAANL